ncbi:MAG TPA: RsmF rRNA methyltransferase first C-terminal domain-containing protein [Spirochaetota bacterium]|nr:RsmF rRNA methyltransferase first C-terminal domain-containing protein [Spirochaetota bacterium]HOM39113.1 RsmF rRNA methyltransferase first C-terminal domain-containing protein [Spirochaetota bacterium]HPQ49996.1 RsmF rRNA methyltransferase first C-terminal domain-containing protein [Spirochaetota bacterium]
MIRKLPEEFVKKTKILLGNSFENYLNYFNDENKTFVRPNFIKVTENDFLNIFKDKISNRIKWETGFLVKDKKFFSKTPYYHTGIYYIQEASSMLPVALLDPKPGEIILDACASPGSKTTQIAGRMLNRGVIVANEVKHSRTGRLLENISRAGIKNCIVTSSDLSKFYFAEGLFDKILVDAPCSGEGMFKRDDDAIKAWSPNLVRMLSGIQKQILKNIAPLLKVGGTLVYSTCTMSVEENEENIDWFIKNFPFKLEDVMYGVSGFTSFQDKVFSEEIKKTKRIFPFNEMGDPFFVAKMIKIGNDRNVADNRSRVSYSNKVSKKQDSKKLFEMFENIGIRLRKNMDILTLWNNIYDVSNIDISLLNKFLDNRIKIIYSGVKLGENKKNRVEPDYSLAMSIMPDEIDKYNSVELNDEYAIKYLRGEILDIKLEKGYYIVTYKNYPIGWLKYSDTMKNLFPHYIRGKI